MKNSKKILSVIVACLVLLAMSTSVFAASGLVPKPTPDLPGNGGIGGMVDGVLGLIQAIGIGVACGMIFYVGIKYTMASANEKADLKNSSIRYLIGAIILFSLTATFGIIEKLMTEIGG